MDLNELDWIEGPMADTIICHGPWWYDEFNPSERDVAMAAMGDKLLLAGYVKRESWVYNGMFITRYVVTVEGKKADRVRRKALDKKFAKIFKEIGV